MEKRKIDLTCKCGHLKSYHEKSQPQFKYRGDSYCHLCSGGTYKARDYALIIWHDFVPNNISLIEDAYNRSTK